MRRTTAIRAMYRSFRGPDHYNASDVIKMIGAIRYEIALVGHVHIGVEHPVGSIRVPVRCDDLPRAVVDDHRSGLDFFVGTVGIGAGGAPWNRPSRSRM